MKNRLKRYRITAALAIAVFCACVFAACAQEETRYLYIKNTNDEAINLVLYFKGGQNYGGIPVGSFGETVNSQTIPANTTVEFVLGGDVLSMAGWYMASAEVVSKPGKYVRKHVYVDNGDNYEKYDLIVVF